MFSAARPEEVRRFQCSSAGGRTELAGPGLIRMARQSSVLSCLSVGERKLKLLDSDGIGWTASQSCLDFLLMVMRHDGPCAGPQGSAAARVSRRSG